jgi:hypothetical protein
MRDAEANMESWTMRARERVGRDGSAIGRTD